MGLQLSNYDSDTESDGESDESKKIRSTVKDPPLTGTNQQNGPGETHASMPLRERGKRPLKIGPSHPLLGKASKPPSAPDDDIMPADAALSSKKIQPQRTSSAGGKSGLVDILPPPKKKARTISKASPASLESASSRFGDPSLAKTIRQDSGGTKEPDITVPYTTGNKKHVDLFGLGSTPPNGKQLTLAADPSLTISAAPLESLPDPRLWTHLAVERDAQNPYYNPSNDLVSKGALGHAWRDVTEHSPADMPDWDVKRNMAEARQLEEERAKLMAAPVYAEQTSYKAVGRTNGLAGKRHQLSALLQDAHSNRRALEDRIAENKRNKREAGTKYGF